MSPAYRRPRIARRQAGFSLIAAIFLLVVLAGLGAVIVTVSSVQHTTTSSAVQGSRAYQAARTGIEWGIFRVLDPPVGCFAPGPPLTLNSPPGLDGFQVSVTCAATNHQEAGAAFQVFRIISTSTAGVFGNPNFASRRIEVTVTDAP